MTLEERKKIESRLARAKEIEAQIAELKNHLNEKSYALGIFSSDATIANPLPANRQQLEYDKLGLTRSGVIVKIRSILSERLTELEKELLAL